MQETILILDFGSQYTQLIARRLRELNVYCEITPWNKPLDLTENIKGVIFSGSPFSVRDENSPVPKVEMYKVKFLCWQFVLVLNF
jgi:GMP synthase (glutamine-hydrolysing)